MKTIEIYKNYGVLGAEKRKVYTYGAQHSQATCFDKIMAQVPTGWKLYKNNMDQDIAEAPWGWTYMINEVLTGDDNPCFMAIDPKGNQVFNNLKVLEEDQNE